MATKESQFKVEDFKMSVKEASKDDIAKALELLAKEKFRQARYEAGELKKRPPKYATEEEKKEAQRIASERRTAKLNIAFAHYTEMGYTVSEDQINEYLAKKKSSD